MLDALTTKIFLDYAKVCEDLIIMPNTSFTYRRGLHREEVSLLVGVFLHRLG
jgi:hypothetical protein